MRHLVSQALACVSVLVASASASAQIALAPAPPPVVPAVPAQLLQSTLTYSLDNGIMYPGTQLPYGTPISLQYGQVAYNPVTGAPDLQRTMNLWMNDRAAMTGNGMAGLYTSQDGTMENYFPILASGQTMFVPLSSFNDPNFARLMLEPSSARSLDVRRVSDDDDNDRSYRSSRDRDETSESDCRDCKTNVANLAPAPQTQATSLTDVAAAAMGPETRGSAVAEWTSAQAPRIAPASRRYTHGARCARLMDSNGNVGSLGKDMAKMLLASPLYEKFFKAGALGRFCPKFDSLSQQRKLQAWMWFWTSLANEESSCNENVIHGTTAKTKKGKTYRLNPYLGAGMWAAEMSPAIRRQNGRMPECANIGTPIYRNGKLVGYNGYATGQALCAFGTMMKTDFNKGQNAYSSDSYWGPVRRYGSQITPHMRRFTECF